MFLARAEGVDQSAGEIFSNAQRVLFLIFAFQRGAADGVNRLALLIHYIVVFEKMFAGLEVLGFNGLLGVLDTTRNELRFDGHPLGHAQAVHQSFYAFTAKNAKEIVFERKKEARRARIALAPGAAAELVINAASLVAFIAEHVESVESDHLR